MSTMPATGGHSKPCCNVPPIVTKGYKPKGAYEEIGGYKTYVTGPSDATRAIVVIYDIFGYFEQTVQGADILAHSDSEHKYKVLIPDWFKGNPAAIEWYPPDTSEKKEKLGAFFGKFPPPATAAKLPTYVQAVKQQFASLTKFGIVGQLSGIKTRQYCWGGKVATLATKADNNVFGAIASVHPAMVDPADAKGINVPMALLASGDEPAEDVKKFEDTLKVPKHVEIFKDQIHGWMAARSDLSNDRVKEEYERGYKTLLSFFGQHL
ncbi:Dienelactone hydrolase, partial [Metarhizium brunneum ARSEF 3297]